MKLSEIKLAVLGLGYVGLPLAVEFGKFRKTMGFDINERRVEDLKRFDDNTLEVEAGELEQSCNLIFTSDLKDIRHCNCYIVTVPTPLDDYNRPDLRPLINASESLGSILKKGDIVIYESTVYPGCTEEDCVPILERASGLVFNEDFFCGYSPERINPGDKKHRVSNIIKITSGSTPKVANLVNDLYSEIVTAGTHKAPTIKVAEAAKVIENTQRDVNIALINELSLIFNLMGIETQDVLDAASTKWNFLNFTPGLVGGHCIGVDPYYLTHKAQKVGYHPEIILAGRRINDGMALCVVNKLIKAMILNGIEIQGSRILVMGLAFKENCPDIRNTKVIDIINGLSDFGSFVDVYDPKVNLESAVQEFGIELIEEPPFEFYDAVIIAVAHSEFKKMGSSFVKRFCKSEHLIFDLKQTFSAEESDLRL